MSLASLDDKGKVEMITNARMVHIVFLVWLSLWLLFSLARECFDLLGKLWALMAFDLIQVLALCSGLFTLCQRKRRILPILCVFSFFSLAYNIALLLWWTTELLTDHRKSDWLAFGLPFGHSFFLRHTPFCPAHFNLTTHRWEQSNGCILPYNWLEAAQSLVHIILAIGTICLAIILLCQFKRQDRFAQTAQRVTRRASLSIAGQPFEIRGIKQNRLEISQEISSGYMNSLCDGENPFAVGVAEALVTDADKVAKPMRTNDRTHQSGIMPVPPMPRRRSFPSKRNKNGNKENINRKKVMMTSDNYSSLSTAECNSAIVAHAKSISRSSSDDSSSQQPLRLYSRQSNYGQPFYSQPMPSQQRGGSMRTLSGAAKTISSGTEIECNSNGANGIHRGAGERRSTNVTSLVSFDPKARSGQLIQVREHRTSDEEDFGNSKIEERKEILENEEERHQERMEENINISLESIPSTEAPYLMAKNFQNIDEVPIESTSIPKTVPTSSNTPLRQRVIPNMTYKVQQYHNQLNNNPSTDQSNSPGIKILNSPAPIDDWMLSNNSYQMNVNLNSAFFAPSAVPSTSIYETYVGSVPQDACTSFPAVGGPPRRSLVQLEAASEIRLSRQDLSKDREDVDQEYIPPKNKQHRGPAPPMGMLV